MHDALYAFEIAAYRKHCRSRNATDGLLKSTETVFDTDLASSFPLDVNSSSRWG
jgi:hypothetical protein